MILGFQLGTSGKLAAARKLLTTELQWACDRGNLEHESFALLVMTELEVRAGELARADAHARQHLELVLGTEMSNFESAARGAYALVDAHLGRIESARAHADRGLALAADADDRYTGAHHRQVLGFLELSLGNGKAALRWLHSLPARIEDLGIREPGIFCVEGDLAEALLLCGDLDGASEVQEALEARGRELRRPWAIATARRCRGLIAGSEGRHAAAVADLEAALALHEEVAQPFERARTLLALGVARRRAKQRGLARAALQQRWRRSQDWAPSSGPSVRGRTSPALAAAAPMIASS